MLNPLDIYGRWAAARRDQQQDFDHALAVCAIFKNEAPYLEEWLTFHHGVGVDHFYLYDDGSEDGFQEILDPWIEKGLVSVTSWTVKNQVAAYNHCLSAHRMKALWMAFIDLDEFLFSPTGKPLPQVLEGYRDVTALFVYWVLFGSSGHQTRPSKPVIEAYTRCLALEGAMSDTFDHGKKKDRSNYVTGWSRDGKSVVNPRRVKFYNIHKPKMLWTGEVLDEKRRPALQRDPDTQITYDVLRINHYWAKSIREITDKVERGSINNRRRPKRNLKRWLEREQQLNTDVDETILPIWRRINAETKSTETHTGSKT